MESTHSRMSNTPSLAIVDDEPAVVRFLTTFFRRTGFDVNAMEKVSDLVPWLESNPCDCLLLDLHMPDIDGFTLLCMLHEKFPELPVIIFTGIQCDGEEQRAILTAGAFDYICKGASLTETLEVVERAVEQHRKLASA